MMAGTIMVQMEMLFVPQDGEVNIDGQIVYLYANGRQAKGRACSRQWCSSLL